MSKPIVIQIYAFTDVRAALQAVELGVDQLGLVAGDYGIVNAELSFERAAQIVRAVGRQATSVALTMADDPSEILRMISQVQPDIVHISSDPQLVGVDGLLELRRGLGASVKLMKAIPVSGPESIDLARKFAPLCDFLLLDSKVAGLPGVGATGVTHDWSISRKIVDEISVPVILAGGLDPDNVQEAIALVNPWGVDSNTGTNLAGDPVRKDPERIARFVTEARKSDRARDG